jgi:hypothetical protein
VYIAEGKATIRVRRIEYVLVEYQAARSRPKWTTIAGRLLQR